MSDKLTVVETPGVPTLFEPERHRLRVAAVNFTIEEAKRIEHWSALEDTVDQKIKEQVNFVTWWEGAVRRPGQPEKNSSGTRLIPCSEAEKLTGMKQPRVSDLGKCLEQPNKYREALLGAEYRAANPDGLMRMDHLSILFVSNPGRWYAQFQMLPADTEQSNDTRERCHGRVGPWRSREQGHGRAD